MFETHVLRPKRALIVMLFVLLAYAFGMYFALTANGQLPETDAEEILREIEASEAFIPEIEVPSIMVEPGPDGSPVVAIDILKAFANPEVQRAWSEAGEFRLRMPLDLIQAIVRTGYEPIKETGAYATQSPLHLVGTLGVAAVATRAAQGKLDDDIDDIIDLFDSSDDGGEDSFDLVTSSESSTLEASGLGSAITVKDASQSPLQIIATDGGTVTVDFQQE